MSFPLFLRGMLFALTAFAITTYFVTQSFWTTFVWTLFCAVLVQVGYFIAVLAMVWSRKDAPTARPVPPEARKSAISPTEGERASNSEKASG